MDERLEFQGEAVTDVEGRMPATAVAMDSAYARGTRLRLAMEVRVKSVRYEENRKGELVLQHVFALESVDVVSAFNPADAADSVGGTAAAQRALTEEEAGELGIAIGRTSDHWPPRQIAVVDGKVIDEESGEVLGVVEADESDAGAVGF